MVQVGRLEPTRKREIDIFSRYQFGTLNNDAKSLRSQNVTSSRGQNIKYAPYVFTEEGVAMLSSVLNSERAIQVNIQIMRTFTKLRKMLMTRKELKEKIEAMENKYDKKFRVVFQVIKLLIKEEEAPKEKIGFKA